jgi:hypothetical protein
MAIDPDGIIGKATVELSEDELKAVEDLETAIDDYLLLNYYKGGSVTYALSVEVALPILYELIRRYREVGWMTYVNPGYIEGTDIKNYRQPVITFWKRGELDDEPDLNVKHLLTTQ